MLLEFMLPRCLLGVYICAWYAFDCCVSTRTRFSCWKICGRRLLGNVDRHGMTVQKTAYCNLDYRLRRARETFESTHLQFRYSELFISHGWHCRELWGLSSQNLYAVSSLFPQLQIPSLRQPHWFLQSQSAGRTHSLRSG